MKRYLLLALLPVLTVACQKKTDCGCVPPPPNYLKAVVVQTSDMSCGKPVLDFEDSVQIRGITKKDGLRFVIDQLPANLNVQGKKLFIAINLPRAEDDFVCTAAGPGYPHLKLVNGKERE